MKVFLRSTPALLAGKGLYAPSIAASSPSSLSQSNGISISKKGDSLALFPFCWDIADILGILLDSSSVRMVSYWEIVSSSRTSSF